jgi:hypothetical protein
MFVAACGSDSSNKTSSSSTTKSTTPRGAPQKGGSLTVLLNGGWRELYERPLMDPNIGPSKLLWGTDWGASMQIYSQPGGTPPSYPVQLRNEGIPHYRSTTGAGACAS